MELKRIADLPTSPDLNITPSTLVAVRNGCEDVLYRMTAGEVAKSIGWVKPATDKFDKLTAQDRHNLCDIVWYLKGMKAADASPFTDQIDTLEEIVRLIGDKLRAENK